MRFLVLGPLEAWLDGREVDLGGGKQRALLARLLLHPGEVVSTDRLIEDLWGSRQPPSAAKLVQGYVSHLRRLLPAETIVTRGAGYLVRVADTDAAEFERSVEEARGKEPSEAARALRAALALWRGNPFAEFEYDSWAQGEIARLRELRLVAVEELLGARLQMGAAAEVVPELEKLVAEQPLREGLRALLMLALYRSGRQVEALDSYRLHRRLLADELGLEPAQPLQELERRILQQDPALDTEAAAAVNGRARSHPVAASLGVAALVAAVTAGAVLAFASGPSRAVVRPNSVAAVDPHSGRVVADIPVGEGPSTITANRGSIWVVNENDETVSLIDSHRRRLVRTFSVGLTPTTIFAGGGSLWVVDVDPRWQTATALRLDPQGVIEQRLRLTLGPASKHKRWIALLAKYSGLDLQGHVWLQRGDDNEITQVDPSDGSRTHDITVGSSASIIDAVAVGAGSVWALDRGTNQLWQIDPVHSVPIRAIPVGQTPLGVTVGAGSVWVANGGDGTLSRLDPTQGRATATIHIGGTPAQIALSGGLVWVSVD